jgi:fumarate hydratase subunit beta
MKELKTPLGSKDVLALKAGDTVYLTGRIFTARDSAHKKMLKEKKLPFDFSKSLVIFHAGPMITDSKCIALGPTTSSRMDEFEPETIRKFGVRAIIGKGGMCGEVVKAMDGKCVYLAFTGGCAAIGASMVKKVVALHWPELGMAEGVWELEIEKFGPLVVAIDSGGKSLYRR